MAVNKEPVKVTKRSLIKKYFSDDLYIELLKITMIADADNNDKGMLIKELLTKSNIPFTALGNGTNRMGLLIDGYAVKFALDSAGKIDNRREMKYTKALQPYVIKVYECTPDGLIAVSEFVEIFNIDDFHTRKNDMAEILSDISQNFLIGDAGITTKNYVNWGKRLDDSICILDFAYIYDVSYNTFKCNEDESLLNYDDNYVKLICPTCGKTYEFMDIRRRITRKQQEEEIGDIRTLSYNIHASEEVVDMVKEFEPVKVEITKKKKIDPIKLLNKEHKKQLKEEKEARKLYDEYECF